ncbi:hypothetical protein LCGC14_1439030 [marine sediment metagenome]|uniref:Uncharacterized protein n=1 Tax=marine sediment metagenome TaxID=412755 RepID=A0A0F9JL87_9ZZZZ
MADTSEDGQCPDCGYAHPNMNEFLELLTNTSSFTVPAASYSRRPQNDSIWKAISQGPIKAAYTLPHDMDDTASQYATEWLNAVQAITNLLTILNAIVEKYNITTASVMEDLPPGIRPLACTSNTILKAEKVLASEKDVFFMLEKMRNEWGSVTAYANAPEEEREAWLNANQTSSGLNTLQMLLEMASAL